MRLLNVTDRLLIVSAKALSPAMGYDTPEHFICDLHGAGLLELLKREIVSCRDAIGVWWQSGGNSRLVPEQYELSD